jgi:hypothetical protein
MQIALKIKIEYLFQVNQFPYVTGVSSFVFMLYSNFLFFEK